MDHYILYTCLRLELLTYIELLLATQWSLLVLIFYVSSYIFLATQFFKIFVRNCMVWSILKTTKNTGIVGPSNYWKVKKNTTVNKSNRAKSWCSTVTIFQGQIYSNVSKEDIIGEHADSIRWSGFCFPIYSLVPCKKVDYHACNNITYINCFYLSNHACHLANNTNRHTVYVTLCYRLPYTPTAAFHGPIVAMQSFLIIVHIAFKLVINSLIFGHIFPLASCIRKFCPRAS